MASKLDGLPFREISAISVTPDAPTFDSSSPSLEPSCRGVHAFERTELQQPLVALKFKEDNAIPYSMSANGIHPKKNYPQKIVEEHRISDDRCDSLFVSSSSTPDLIPMESDSSSNFDASSFLDKKRNSCGSESGGNNCGVPDSVLQNGTMLLHPPAGSQHYNKTNLIIMQRIGEGSVAHGAAFHTNLALREMFQSEEDSAVQSPKFEKQKYMESDELNQREYFDGYDQVPNNAASSQRGTQFLPSSVASFSSTKSLPISDDGSGLMGTPPSSLRASALTSRNLNPNQSVLHAIGPLSPPATPPQFGTSDSTAESPSERYQGVVRNQPVLYSAIGSLEDPSNSSYTGWKSRSGSNANVRKYEFHSSSHYIPPQNKNKNYTFDDATTPAISNQRKKAGTASQASSKLSHHEVDANGLGSASNVNVESLTDETTNGQKKKDYTAKPRSNLREENVSTDSVVDAESDRVKSIKKVTISSDPKIRKPKKKQQVVEMFRPSSDAYTPRMGKKEIKYKPAEMRTPVQQMASPLGTLSRPNFRDALRRVSMIIQQHILKIERRFEQNREIQENSSSDARKSLVHNSQEAKGRFNPSSKHQRKESDGLFHLAMKEEFSDDRYITPKYKCTMVRVPMARMGMVCGLKRIRQKYEIPTESEIYEFAHQLFKKVQLSSECSIVCLIYVERLMEVSKVPLLASTWRPIFMCGLLLASKVWQDLSSWNIEFASVYPQYSLDAINRLELQFLRSIKWELYISSSLYAKYYFALRSLVEKPDFRQRYNRMVGGVNNVKASEARKIEERTSMFKEEVLLHLSRSM